MTLNPDCERSGPRVARGDIDRPPGPKFIATNPPRAYSTSDLDALSTFVSDGGAVVLTASAEATDRMRSDLNDVAAGLGSDLRINDDQVFDAYTDDTSGTNGAPTVNSLSARRSKPTIRTPSSPPTGWSATPTATSPRSPWNWSTAPGRY